MSRHRETWCDCAGAFVHDATCDMCPTEAEIDAAKASLHEYETNGGKTLEEILGEIRATFKCNLT